MDDETECKLLIVGYILAVLLWCLVKIAAVGLIIFGLYKLLF